MKPSRVFLPAILSGVLLWTAFFPLDLGPVAYVALAPFLTLVRAQGVGPRRRYLAAYAGGLVFHVVALNWIRVAHPMMAMFAYPGLVFYCSLYWPLALLLLRKLDRLNLPLAVTVPVVWVGLEYLRAHFPTGFPFLSHVSAHQLAGFGWYFLGYTQHHVLPLIQAADAGGVYLVSVGVAAVNGAAAEWLPRVGRAGRLFRLPAGRRVGYVREMAATAGAVAVPLVLVCYGAVRLAHPPFGKGPRVAALQGNIAQDEKVLRGEQKPDDQQQAPVDAEYKPLAVQAGRADGKTLPPDLIVWPETCWADNLPDVRPGAAGDPARPRLFDDVGRWRAKVGRDARDVTGTHALLGLNVDEWGGDRWRRYNSAVLVRPDGALAGRYDKIHLVPFGEYVPLKERFPWLRQFTPYEHDYSCTPGESWTRFDLPTRRGVFRFGVLICYEDSDPYLARRYNPAAGEGPGVDFLVNISNDGWFDGTEEHEQHLAICRFRAVEARRAVVRAVNMGISGVIDPDGRVVALPGETWAGSKKIKGTVVRAEVPVDGRDSLYAAAGDWVPGLCWGLAAAGLVAARRRGAAG